MTFDLQRYNRVVWALIGTLLLLGALALLVTGVSALWPSRQEGGSLPTASGTSNEGAAPAASALRLGIPRPLNGTDTLLVPVEGLLKTMEEPRGFGSYSKGGPEAPLFNLLFVDARTRASQALLNGKGLITHYDVLEDDRSPSAKAVGLVLRIVESDTNGNGRLDDGDEDRVYLCDTSGKNLRVVSPADNVCERFQYDAGRRTLYLLIHSKGQPYGKGSTEAFLVSLDGVQPAQPLVSKGQMDELRGILQH